MDRLQGATLGNYRLDILIGRGNRASVYQATPLAGGQNVAIRVFDRTLNADIGFTERFRRLAETLTTVQHPHILPVIECAEQDGFAYIVRPYVSGSALRRLLGTPMPVAEVLRLLRPIAAALDYAHHKGIIHGDVKPGNILLARSGQVQLVDLGIAQLLPRGSSLLMTATGRYYGTPEYLSPEQAHGIAQNEQTDEYALGIIIYEALVGRPPFRAESPADTPRAVAARHITATPPAPRTLNPSLDPAVEQVLLRAIDKDPERRFPTCLDLVASLAEAGGNPVVITTVLASPPPVQTALLVNNTELLIPGEEPIAEAAPPDADWLVAQHAAEMRVLTAAYETQLAAQAEALRGRDALIATLTQQVAAAQSEQARLQAQLAEFEAVVRERDALVARVRDLERPQPAAAERPGGPADDNEKAGGSGVRAQGRLAILEPQRFGLPRGANFSLGLGAIVGRHPESAVHIDDHFLSARHAQLTRQADGWWVTDLGTTNGTFVNGERIKSPTQINVGDVLRFGRVRASFA